MQVQQWSLAHLGGPRQSMDLGLDDTGLMMLQDLDK